jgi:hypothetical protein
LTKRRECIVPVDNGTVDALLRFTATHNPELSDELARVLSCIFIHLSPFFKTKIKSIYYSNNMPPIAGILKEALTESVLA